MLALSGVKYPMESIARSRKCIPGSDSRGGKQRADFLKKPQCGLGQSAEPLARFLHLDRDEVSRERPGAEGSPAADTGDDGGSE